MLAEVSLTQQQYRAHLRRSRRTEVAGEGVLHCDVRAYLLSAPRWVLALVQGVFFGAGLTVFSLVSTDRHWVGAVVRGAVGGVFFGAVMAPIAHR